MKTFSFTTIWTSALRRSTRIAGFGFSFASALTMAVSPASAAITNTATASGTYGGNPVTSTGSDASVDVAAGAPVLTVTKTAGTITTALGAVDSITDGSDTITYTVSIKNDGNVTITGVKPTDAGPTFNGTAGTGSWQTLPSTMTAQDLAPGATADFTLVWVLSTEDAIRAAAVTNGVANTASATGTPAAGTLSVTPGSTTTTIAAGPHLTIQKAAVLTDGTTGTTGMADVGETITYTYTIKNDGNVPLTGVAVSDTHEGVLLASSVYTNEALVTEGPVGTSTDASLIAPNPNDGVWDTLQPGATITIQYIHTVIQAEVDAG